MLHKDNPVNDYVRRSEVDRLTTVIYEDVLPTLERVQLSSIHIIEMLKPIQRDLEEIKKRNLEQDTVFKILKKSLKKAPTIIFFLVSIGFMLNNPSFGFRNWMTRNSTEVVKGVFEDGF